MGYQFELHQQEMFLMMVGRMSRINARRSMLIMTMGIFTHPVM
jgi:hypothetical protein